MSAPRYYQLKERAFVNGAVREPGYVFERRGNWLPSRDVQGPGGSVISQVQAVALDDAAARSYEAELAASRDADEQRGYGREPAGPEPPAQPEPPPKRYRLTAQAYMHGAVQEPGYEFDLPKDDKGNETRGPHRTVHRRHDRIDATTDNIRINGEVVDEPLYKEIAPAREELDGPRAFASADAPGHVGPGGPERAADGPRAQDRGAEVAPPAGDDRPIFG